MRRTQNDFIAGSILQGEIREHVHREIREIGETIHREIGEIMGKLLFPLWTDSSLISLNSLLSTSESRRSQMAERREAEYSNI